MARDLVYRVTIDTSQARRAASSIRATIEAELRTIQIGQLNISSLTAATNEAQRFRVELENAARAADSIQVRSGAVPTVTPGSGVRRGGGGDGQDLTGVLDQIPVVGQFGSALVGGFAAGAVVAGIKEIGQALDELSRRGAVFSQVSDVLDDYAASVGTTSKAIVSAAKEAAQGTISEFDLILNANRALQFQVAQTPEQYAKLIELSTALGRAQGITDTDALDYIVRGIARQSSLILDNLGLFIDLEKVQAEYAASLGKTSSELTAAEKNQAVLNEAFRQGQTAIQANRDAADSAATQYEKFDANVQNLKDTFGAWLASVSADEIGALADAIGRVNAELNGDRRSAKGIQQDIDDLVAVRDKLARGQDVSVMGVTIPGGAESVAFYTEKIEEATRAKLETLAASRDLNETNQQAAYLSMQAANAFTIEAENARRAAELKKAAALENLSDGQISINKGLDSAAQKSVGDLGLENTIALLKEQKLIVDAAIQELAASAITDPDEIALRIAEIQQAATDAFKLAAESMPEVDPSVTAGSFDVINQSMQALNQGFVDFLPSASAVRDELASLAEEVMFTGVVTDEQSAALQNYASVAASIADETSMLAAVTDELGVSFLYANPEAAGLVDAMYAAQASYLNGSITAEAYAGMLSALGQQLLILAQQAGVATGSILTLVQAQAGLAGKGSFQIGAARGNAVIARLQAQQQERERQRAIQEAERAAKRAAQEQERSAKRAGKELESAAKKAGQELKSALDKVPGLFSRTQVTEQDMKFSKAGVYQDKADEYLRRLQAEVEQGKDLFADVSIEDARQSLTALGVQVAEDNQVAFEQFVEAYESGLLFADPANVEKYINKDAVEREMELQKKAEEGRNNVYKAFGVVIEDAAAAAAGGASGGGVSVADIDFTPAVAATIGESELFNGKPYLLNINPVVDTQSLSDQLRTTSQEALSPYQYTVQPTYDPKTFPPYTPSAMGLADLGTQGNAQITVGTMLDDVSFGDLFEKIESTVPTIHVNTLLDDVAFGDVYTKITSTKATMAIGIKLSETVGTNLVTGLGEQIGQNVAAFSAQGQAIGSILAAGAVTGAEGGTDIGAGLLSAIATDIAAQSQFFLAQGQTVGAIVKGGVASAFSAAGGADSNGQAQTDIAMGLVGALNSQFSASQNFFYAAGQTPAFSTLDGFKATFGQTGEGAPLVTPMVTALNTQIRMKGQDFQNQGITIAQYVQNGLSVGFNSEAFKTTLISVGESLYASIRTGLIRAADGGDLVESLGAKILADISGTVEAAE